MFLSQAPRLHGFGGATGARERVWVRVWRVGAMNERIEAVRGVRISLRERLRPVLNRCRVCAMTTNLRGRRVRLITTTDPYTNLRMGDEGTIVLVDDLGTVHVSWDNGSSLGLVPREDHWQLLDK